jgi:N-acetylated-alpha-linked acidic dipeptidase
VRSRSARLPQLNAILRDAERALLRDDGLPRRPWYRHQIYAPGFYTGYGVKTLPGLREGIEERSWNEAREYIGILTGVLDRMAAEIGRARALLM